MNGNSIDCFANRGEYLPIEMICEQLCQAVQAFFPEQHRFLFKDILRIQIELAKNLDISTLTDSVEGLVLPISLTVSMCGETSLEEYLEANNYEDFTIYKSKGKSPYHDLWKLPKNFVKVAVNPNAGILIFEDGSGPASGRYILIARQTLAGQPFT